MLRSSRSFSPRRALRRGFTLVELLIAVSVTALLLVLLVNLVTNAADSWSLGRARLATNSEARTALDTFARDMQSAVIRSTPADAVWIEVTGDAPANASSGSGEISSSSRAIHFFSPIVDRETVADDDDEPTTPLAGDVCGVTYRIAFQDPLATTGDDMNMFALYREVKSPSETFDELIGSNDLAGEWSADPPTPDDYLAGDILDCSLSFVIKTATGQTVIVPPGVALQATSSGVECAVQGLAGDAGLGARVVAIEANITVIDESGAELVRQMDQQNASLSDVGFDDVSDFINKHGYQFSQRIPLYAGF